MIFPNIDHMLETKPSIFYLFFIMCYPRNYKPMNLLFFGKPRKLDPTSMCVFSICRVVKLYYQSYHRWQVILNTLGSKNNPLHVNDKFRKYFLTYLLTMRTKNLVKNKSNTVVGYIVLGWLRTLRLLTYMNFVAAARCICVLQTYLFIKNVPLWGRRGLKSRIRPPYLQCVVKGD